MGKETGISWTDATFNPWRGCTKVSHGCAHCYAETLSRRNPATLGVWGPSGTRVVAAESMWRQPLKWDREAREAGERRRVFCASLADVFEDWGGPMIDSMGNRLYSNVDVNASAIDGSVGLTMDGVRANLLQLIYRTPNLDWLLLTKRPENVVRMIRRAGDYFPPSSPERKATTQWMHYLNPPDNVWIGTSVEDQETADVRIPKLLKIPAKVRFLSMEPLLGPVDLRKGIHLHGGSRVMVWRGLGTMLEGINWVIVGGESGGNARPFDLHWARSVRDQCEASGTDYFLKQLGSNCQGYWLDPNGPGDGICYHSPDRGWKLKDSHGGDIEEFPQDLRIRQFPRPASTRPEPTS